MKNTNIKRVLFLTLSFLLVGCGDISMSSISNEPSSSENTVEDSITSSSNESTSSLNDTTNETSLIDLSFDKWKSASGNTLLSAEGIVATSTNTISYLDEDVFDEGTFSINMKVGNSKKDNGIIFGLAHTEKEFWETSCSYYFYFISQAGTAYLGKVNNGWSVLNESPIIELDTSATHELKIIRSHESGYDNISGYIDGAQLNNYRDYSPLIGKQVGLRAGGADTTYKNITITSDKGEVNNMEGFTPANGLFEKVGDNYVSKTGNAILTSETISMAYGTISANINISVKGDNGIIFALDDGGLYSYWESNVSYYFFFISQDGSAYLGQVNNGAWSALSVVSFPSYALNTKFSIKIVRDSMSIYCYINDALYINYLDEKPLTGTKVGFRSGSIGNVYSDLVAKPSGEYDYKTPEGFSNVSGELLAINSSIKSTKDKTLSIYKDEMNNGTISVKMSPGSFTNNGIVFRLTSPATDSYYERVEGLSYYFFHISTNSSSRLIKFDGTKATVISEFGLSAGYAAGKESLIRVIMNDNNFKCYVDDACFVDFTDTEPLSGTKIGLRASAKGVLFTDFGVTNSKAAISADLVLFGHSHAQLYDNCHTDLASVGDVANMGVGGSIISNWTKRLTQIASYNSKYIVCWLGSNDIGAGLTPSQTVSALKSLLSEIHALTPTSKIIICTEFYQPETSRTTEAFKQSIRSINESYKTEMESYINVVDLFDIPLKDGVLDTSMFRDVFHLTNESYKEVTKRLLALIATL